MGDRVNLFGSLLKKYRQQTFDSEKGGYLTQARFAELLDLGFSGTMVGHWETGERIIKHQDRFLLQKLIQVLHQYEGIQSLDEANNLLETGQYSRLSPTEIQAINPNWLANQGEELQSSLTIILSVSAINDWLDSLFRWSEVDDHARTSLSGMIIWSLSSVLNRVTASSLFYFLCAILIWIFSALFILPLLQLPFDNPSMQVRASIMYAIATVMIPIAISLISHPDLPQAFFETDHQPKRTIFFLKLTGAAVGFNLVTSVMVFLALIFFYIGLSPSLWIWWVLLSGPMLMAYVGAQRIPADRYKMYNGTLRRHPGDILFLITFLLIGIVLGLFVYFWADYLSNKAMGLSLAIVFAGSALWYRQKQIPIPDPLLISIIGILIPILIISIFIFVFPSRESEMIIEGTTFPEQVLLLVYVISAITIWVTVQLRNPPKITLQGGLGLLFISLILLGLIGLDLTWGRLGILLTIAVWIIWGKKRFQSHLWIHASIVYLVISFFLSLYLTLDSTITISVNLIGYALVSSGLILWAYWSGMDSKNLEIVD